MTWARFSFVFVVVLLFFSFLFFFFSRGRDPVGRHFDQRSGCCNFFVPSSGNPEADLVVFLFEDFDHRNQVDVFVLSSALHVLI